MFSPLLESMLGQESSLVKFQRELYIFSGPSSRSGFSFIFPEERFEIETATQQTRLQREIAGLLRRGGSWRIGGMFYLTDDVNAYGTQPYLRGFMRQMDRAPSQHPWSRDLPDT